MENAIHTLLHNTHVVELVKNQKIITIFSDETVEQAVKVLSEHKISGMPVVDRETGEIAGVIDMLDVVSYVLFVSPEGDKLSAQSLQRLETEGRVIALETVKHVMDFSGRDPYIAVSPNSALSFAVSLFSRALHRMPVVNNENKVEHSLSQFDVVKFVHEKDLHRGHLKDVGDKTLKELGLGVSGVFTAPRNSSVYNALHLMQTKLISGVALVDDDGKLAGNFSATDLRGLYLEKFPMLLQPVSDYLEEFSPSSLNAYCVKADATFANVVKELVESKLHRVWVIDDDYKPIGIVSLTDICAIFSKKAF